MVTVENNGTITNVVFKTFVPNLITFQINSTLLIDETKTYTAEEGMTFRQFCNSAYNVDGWTIVYNEYSLMEYVQHQHNGYIVRDGSSIRPDTIIDPLSNYYWDDMH